MEAAIEDPRVLDMLLQIKEHLEPLLGQMQHGDRVMHQHNIAIVELPLAKSEIHSQATPEPLLQPEPRHQEAFDLLLRYPEILPLLRSRLHALFRILYQEVLSPLKLLVKLMGAVQRQVLEGFNVGAGSRSAPLMSLAERHLIQVVADQVAAPRLHLPAQQLQYLFNGLIEVLPGNGDLQALVNRLSALNMLVKLAYQLQALILQPHPAGHIQIGIDDEPPTRLRLHQNLAYLAGYLLTIRPRVEPEEVLHDPRLQRPQIPVPDLLCLFVFEKIKVILPQYLFWR